MLKTSILETPLTELLCIKIHGEEASSFLQSQLTIDVTRLKNGQSRLGAYCEPKGRVISTLILAFINGDFYILVPAVLKDDVINTLLKYRFRAKVEFSPVTDSRVYGSYEDNPGADIFIPHPLDKLRFFRIRVDLQTDNSTKEEEVAAWSRADFSAGMVWLDQRTTRCHLPQSLGLIEKNAVDFDKGCYPGQEIIARLKYLGKTKHTTRKFLSRMSNGELVTANFLRDHSGKRQGQRLNSFSLDGKTHGLTVVSCTALAANTRLCFVDENAECRGGDIVIEQP